MNPRHITLVVLSLACLATPIESAQAADPNREWAVGVGGLGYVGGNFLSEPSDETYPFGNRRVAVPYPGFGGVGGGGGLAIAAMWRGILGVELDLLYTVDSGTGQINDRDVTITNNALHIPITLRAQIPYAQVRPFALIGIDCIVNTGSSAEADSALLADLDAEGTSGVALHFGVGFDFLLPTEPDIRIPLTLRASMRSLDSDDLTDRYSDISVSSGTNLRSATFKSDFEWHAGATLGVMFYFL
jgi:opacity protein-like surface antigen